MTFMAEDKLFVGPYIDKSNFDEITPWTRVLTTFVTKLTYSNFYNEDLFCKIIYI